LLRVGGIDLTWTRRRPWYRKVNHRLCRPTGGQTLAAWTLHSPSHTNSFWVPHVRISVRGISKTGQSPFEGPCLSLFRHHQSSGAPSFALLAKGGISRTCGEGLRVQSRGIPPFAKSAKDGAPKLWFSRMECFFSAVAEESENARIPHKYLLLRPSLLLLLLIHGIQKSSLRSRRNARF
jgi:hypothetical protein